jgi:protein TonB
MLVFSFYLVSSAFCPAASTAPVRLYEREMRDTTPQSGDRDTVFTKVDVEAMFPGGNGMWNNYVMHKIAAQFDKLQDDGKSGTVEIQFTVRKDGMVTDIQVLTMPKMLLAKIAVNMVANGPRWVPATVGGQPVNSYRRQKVTFIMPDAN